MRNFLARRPSQETVPALLRRSILLLLASLAVALLLAAPGRAQDPTPTDATATPTDTTAMPAPDAPPPAPANDDRADATGIPSLPADLRGTTLGATVEAVEPPSSCGCAGRSLFYRYVASTDGRVVVTLTATDPLDAVLDAYHQQRSQLTRLIEDLTDSKGVAELSFPVKAGQSYLLKVAARTESEDGPFLLHVGAAAAEAKAPGTRLPAAGVTETLDRVLKPEAFHSAELREGRTYRVNIVPITPPKKAAAPTSDDNDDSSDDQDDECDVRLTMLAPKSSVLEGERVERSGCDDYFLYTPGRGEGGLYVFQTDASARARGGQRYHLQVAGAGATDTSPGTFLDNHVRVTAQINGKGVNRQDLYRFGVDRNSSLKLSLGGPASDGLDLTLRSDEGHEIDEGTEIDRQLKPGRYFVTVEADGDTAGRYTLVRSSRTITSTSIAMGGVARARAKLGSVVPVTVNVKPGVGGPVRITLQRFDPVAGWQYLRTVNVQARGGRAAISFPTPDVGRFRAQADYLGTRDAAPSSSGYAQVLVISGSG